MADIFVSYARQDREQARVLAGSLEEQGWSVWWDRTIPPGKSFDDVIESELEAANCVIVLWSRHSVVSRWVRAEISEAAERGVLVPVLIEDVKSIPVRFRQMHAADLAGWDGTSSNQQLGQIFDAVGDLVRRREPVGTVTRKAAGGETVDPEESAEEYSEPDAEVKYDPAGLDEAQPEVVPPVGERGVAFGTAPKQVQTKVDQLTEEEQLDNLWIDAQGQYGSKQWDLAAGTLRKILLIREDYREASTMFTDALMKQRMGRLKDQVEAYVARKDWERAFATLGVMSELDPDDSVVSTRLKETRHQQRVATLHDQAKQLCEAEDWWEAVDLIEQLESEDPQHPDPGGLFARAKSEAEKETLYANAKSLMKEHAWTSAHLKLSRLAAMDPEYRDVQALLDSAAEAGRKQRKQDILIVGGGGVIVIAILIVSVILAS